MAKIGELLGLGDNPFYKGFSANRNAISGAFTGMASNPMNPWGGFGQGAMMGGQADQLDAERQRQQAEQEGERNATRAWLEQSYPEYSMLPPGEGFKLAMAAEQAKRSGGGAGLMSVGGHIYDQNTGQWISPPDSGATSRQNVSLTPQWGQDEQGNWVMLQPSSTGELVRSALPEGVTLADPRTLNMERAQGTAIGQAAGQAQVAAPGDIASGEMALDLINQIKTSPELPWATGMSAGLGGNRIPGTGRYGFQNLVEQAKSGAFLSAVQQMRGMGALSNAEGQAATQAITRMDTALSQADFVKALNDYEQIVQRGLERARARASGNVTGGAPAPAPQGGGFTILGVE